MAKAPKIDEQISYNGVFFVFAGLFGLVTFWAVWDEVITRREYKGYQDEFYKIERKLSHDRAAGAQKALEADPKYQRAKADLVKRREELGGAKRADYEAAKKTVAAAELERFDKQQNLTFAKSMDDENYYYYTLAKQHGKDDPDALAVLTRKKEELGKKVKEADAALTAALNDLKTKQAAVAAFEAPISLLENELETMGKDLKELDRLAGLADERTSEVIQRNLEDIGRVDRCESCHTGAARAGLEEVKPEYFASHPYRRTLLAIHPPEKFGCTLCHDGQGRATQKFHAHAPDRNEDPHAHHSHFWEAPLLRERGSFAGFGDEKVKANFVEGNCRKCHVNQIDLRSTLACEINAECPTGGGLPKLKCAVPTAAGFAPPADAKDAPKYCINDEGRPELVDLAPQQTRGRKIIEEAGCFGCHPMEGYDRPKPAPDLRHVADKLNPDWMAAWIRNPQALRPNTRMPNFFPEDHAAPNEYPEKARPDSREDADQLQAGGELHKWNRDRQIAAMVSFLLKQSTPYPMAMGKTAAGDVKRGDELIKTLGCLGCHPSEDGTVKHKNRGSHFDHGPELTDIGAKVKSADWIFNWLKDPKSYHATARMPNLRLDDRDAGDIAAYLATKTRARKPIPKYAGIDKNDAGLVEKGEWLVKYYGCYGCHTITGYETTPGIGVALSAFGLKTVEQLDFGDVIGDHNRQTWESWTYNKLKRPRVYRYDRVDTRMPQFSFTEQEIKDVMVVLRGMRGEERDPITGRAVPMPTHVLGEAETMREKGRQLVRWYNCYGCHSVDGFTGDIRQAYPGDLASLAPPILNNEGARTQPGWLFDFFKDVKSLRPWLTARMPTFGFTDDQATTLVGMFSAFDKAEFPYRFYSDIKLDGARREMAQAVFDELKCQSCHVLGNVKICGATPEPGCIKTEDAAQKAPNLLMAKDRLRAEWLVKWLDNPEAIMPNTRMPSFFPPDTNQLDAMLNLPETKARFAGVPQDTVTEVRKSTIAQRELLRDYLMTMHSPATAEAAPETANGRKTGGAGKRAGKGKKAAAAPARTHAF